MNQYPQQMFKQTVDIPAESRDTMIELVRAKDKLRKIEEFIRKYETHTDAKGFIAAKVVEILEGKDA